MKTDEQIVVFTEQQVLRYAEMLGGAASVCCSEEAAAIPLPPAMPMTAYPLFELPWTREGIAVLRKQQFIEHAPLYTGRRYRSFIELSNVKTRGRYTFSTETLYFYNEDGALCFTALSELIAEAVE